MSATPGLAGRALLVNPGARPERATEPPSRAPLGVHRRLPGYAVTPLVEAPALARANGVARVWVKDESWRLGLPAFKMLGASWAAYRAVVERLGRDPEPWASLDELRRVLGPLRPLTLAAATDGNHGRAVARMATLLGAGAEIFVPEGTSSARIAAIEGEGARVTVVDGDYDAAVSAAASRAGERCLVIADIAWPGYEQVPTWVVEGYATIFWEVEDQLATLGGERPDVVVVPVGVGALAAAAVRHYRRRGLEHRPRLIGVEPLAAACVLRSLRAGRIVTVPGPHHSIMAGLNCGTPSLVAWPLLMTGLDAVVAVADGRARQAMRDLAAVGVVAGETGAAYMATSPYGGPLISLDGAIDLHCHPYPDLFPRLADDIDIAVAARDAGLEALVLKCHHESTVSRAYLVQRIVPGIRVFGGVVLNTYVGGINPAAVEAALRLGGKEVWMPTVDAGYHAQVHGGTGGYDAQGGGRVQAEGIWVTDVDGQLEPVVKEVLALVAEHQAILARLAVRRPREDRRGGQAGRRLALPARLRHGPAAQPDAVGGPADLRPDRLREGAERGGRRHHDQRQSARPPGPRRRRRQTAPGRPRLGGAPERRPLPGADAEPIGGHPQPLTIPSPNIGGGFQNLPLALAG